MTLIADPLVEVEDELPSLAVRDGLRLAQLPMIGLRLLLGVVLCSAIVPAVLVVGWTFRLMRRRIIRGWWLRSDLRAGVPFDDFARSLPIDVPTTPLPRWFVADGFLERLRRPTRRDRPPGWLRIALRVPLLLVSGAFRNLRFSGLALVTSAVLLFPGALLLLGGWEYGWNVSFFKNYEQAYIGRTVGFLGAVLLALALGYVPIAWSHLAVSGDPRAVFQFRLLFRLMRHKRASLALYAAIVALLNFPASLLWGVVVFLPNAFPWLETATPEQVAHFVQNFALLGAAYVFPAYLVVHLLAARIYRNGLLNLLSREPEWADRLPSSTRQLLQSLDLLDHEPRSRPHPLVRAVLGTGRRGSHALLRLATFLAWFVIPLELLLAQFLVYHPFQVWLNPVLFLIPSLGFTLRASG